MVSPGWSARTLNSNGAAKAMLAAESRAAAMATLVNSINVFMGISRYVSWNVESLGASPNRAGEVDEAGDLQGPWRLQR
jgi:hypothetical protein